MSHPSSTLLGMDRADDLPRVTPAHLRRADEMCRRRLAHEVRGGKSLANKTGDMRFAVSNRLDGDARLAQAEMGRPQRIAFVEPPELEPEQRALYAAAVRGYMSAFGDTDAQIVELPWRSPLEDVGVELVANVGLAAELADGTRELRRLHFGARRFEIDAIDERVALARTADWAPDTLRVVAVDVIEGRRAQFDPVLPEARAEAMEWLNDRVARVLELAADARPRVGPDCIGCAFISGCSVHAS
jgi:hypothetical protein